MSDIEHPSHDDEQINLVPSTVGFAVSAVVGVVGMIAILLFNFHGGF